MKKTMAAGRTILSAGAKRCLAAVLEAELNDSPLEAHVWRAKNSQRIKYIEELAKARIIEYRENTFYVVRFYGLMNATASVAQTVLSHCERLFNVLRKHYRLDPKKSVPIEEIAKRLRLSHKQVIHAAHFLSRSP